MAKSGGDTNSIRKEEVEVETRAAYAGKGDSGDGGEFTMPNVTDDNSESFCQKAANSAKSFNQGGDGSGSEDE